MAGRASAFKQGAQSPAQPECSNLMARSLSSLARAGHEGLEKLRMLLSHETGPKRGATEDHVLSIIACRRGRDAALGRRLFSDPAWDLLLELYAAGLGNRRMTVSDLAKVIDLPQSTTARWIGALVEHGLVLSWAAHVDDAQLQIHLSPRGAREMQRLMDYWRSAFESI